jgi:hypothetical protein
VKPADVKALIEKWRVEAQDEEEGGGAWEAGWYHALKKCADDLDALLHGAGRRGKPCYCCTHGCDPACRCFREETEVRQNLRQPAGR